MSGEGVNVDVDALRVAAGKVEAVSEGLKELEAKAMPHFGIRTWGIAGSFLYATMVRGTVNELKETLRTGADRFGQTSGDLHDTATTYESSDSNIADPLKKLGDSLGGAAR